MFIGTLRAVQALILKGQQRSIGNNKLGESEKSPKTVINGKFLQLNYFTHINPWRSGNIEHF